MLMIASGHDRAELGGEDLHVAGQHDEVHPLFLQHPADRALLAGLVSVRDR